jgi:hypothetical protein
VIELRAMRRLSLFWDMTPSTKQIAAHRAAFAGHDEESKGSTL